MDLVILYFSDKYKGYFHDIYNAIKKKEYIQLEELEKIKLKKKTKEIEAITIIDDDYPDSLKSIVCPPFVIYYKGNKNLLKKEGMILTGDFNNENIERFLNEAMNEISKNHVLITNYWKGIDEKIVNFFIENKKDIILVSPNGLDNPYFVNSLPSIENSENILIISEYPNGVNLNKKRLVNRNRLTVGLSKALVIASSNKESKIQSLVNFALEQGKDIFCYPGLQDELDGNNLLIQDGATLITSIKDKI